MTGASLRIEREASRWKDRGRAYVVLIDGQRAGAIANGETAVFNVEPGEHSLRLQIDWTGSPEVAFGVGEGDIVEFVCRATPLTPLAAARALFSKNRYIALERR